MLYTYPGLLTDILALDSGILLTAVKPLAASATGTTNSQNFTVSERAQGGARDLDILGVPNGAVTTLTVDVEISADAGATWQKLIVGVQLIATSTSTKQRVQGVQAGFVYRINVTTNTGGTSVTVLVTAE